MNPLDRRFSYGLSSPTGFSPVPEMTFHRPESSKSFVTSTNEKTSSERNIGTSSTEASCRASKIATVALFRIWRSRPTTLAMQPEPSISGMTNTLPTSHFCRCLGFTTTLLPILVTPVADDAGNRTFRSLLQTVERIEEFLPESSDLMPTLSAHYLKSGGKYRAGQETTTDHAPNPARQKEEHPDAKCGRAGDKQHSQGQVHRMTSPDPLRYSGDDAPLHGTEDTDPTGTEADRRGGCAGKCWETLTDGSIRPSRIVPPSLQLTLQ